MSCRLPDSWGRYLSCLDTELPQTVSKFFKSTSALMTSLLNYCTQDPVYSSNILFAAVKPTRPTDTSSMLPPWNSVSIPFSPSRPLSWLISTLR